jgi:hypothetical protein
MNSFVVISESTAMRNTYAGEQFFKKYTAFDGAGSFYFFTLKEANRYALNRSRVIQNSLTFSFSQFHVVSKFYIDNLLTLKQPTEKGLQVNEYLRDCLDVIKYLTSYRYKTEYVLSKVIFMLERYLKVCNLLDFRILAKTVEHYLDTLYIDYPVFRSSDYSQKNNIKNERFDFKVSQAV